MEGRNSFAFSVFGTSLGLGVCGVLLFRQAELGINLFAWFMLLLGGFFFLRRGSSLAVSRGALLCMGGAAAFLLCLSWRASKELQVLNGGAATLLLGIAVYKARHSALWLGSLSGYIFGAIESWCWAFADWAFLSWKDVQWKSFAGDERSRKVSAVGRGVAIAVPLLLTFGSLLASADQVFSRMLTNSIKLDGEQTFYDSLTFVGFGILGAWFLRRMLIVDTVYAPPKQQPASKIGFTEIAIVLVSLSVLFAAFVAVQFRYLFGGDNLVQITPGLTYAEYARKGFFELVTVATLLLPTVLCIHSLMPKNGNGQERTYRFMTATLVGLLFVMMASALKRMDLYVDAYGLTLLRVYTSSFMVWLALTFAWFLAAMFGKMYNRFAFGSIVAGLVCIAGLNFLNPDKMIVDVNLRLAQNGQLDGEYLTSLSADAAPSLAKALPSLDAKSAGPVAYRLLEGWGQGKHRDWRSWNNSESEAFAAVRPMESMIKALADKYELPIARESPEYWD